MRSMAWTYAAYLTVSIGLAIWLAPHSASERAVTLRLPLITRLPEGKRGGHSRIHVLRQSLRLLAAVRPAERKDGLHRKHLPVE
jgi:hypothetical protein